MLYALPLCEWGALGGFLGGRTEINAERAGKKAAADARKAKAISKALGKKINATEQTITLERAKHINEDHGAGKEKYPDQIPVTKETFTLIPDVLDNFDTVEKGADTWESNIRKQSVVVRKGYSDGRIVLADAIIDDNSLKIKTMWIEEPTAVRPRNAEAPSGSRLSPSPPDLTGNNQRLNSHGTKPITNNIHSFSEKGTEKDVKFSLSDLPKKEQEIAKHAPQWRVYKAALDFLQKDVGIVSGDIDNLYRKAQAKWHRQTKQGQAGMETKHSPELDKLAERLAQDPDLAALIDYEGDEAGAGERAIEIASDYQRMSDSGKVELGRQAQSGYSGTGETIKDIPLADRIENILYQPELELDGNAHKGKYELNDGRSIKKFILDKLRKAYTNLSTGDKITISNNSAGKLATRYREGGETYGKTIAHIPQIIEKMQFLEEMKPDVENAKYLKYSYYVTPASIDGKPHTILSTVGYNENGIYYDQNVFKGTPKEVFAKAKNETSDPKYSRLNEILQKTESDWSLNSVGTEGTPTASTNKYTKNSPEKGEKSSEKAENSANLHDSTPFGEIERKTQVSEGENGQKGGENGNFERLSELETPETAGGKFLRNIQDGLRDLKDAGQKQARKEFNAYEAYDLMHGKIEWKIKEKLEKGLIEPITEIIKRRGLKAKAVNDYLYALHAKAVNAYVESKNPSRKDGSGHSNEWADDILKKIKELPASEREAFEKIAALNRKMNGFRMNLLVESGLWSEETAAKLREQYPDYVPLRGLPEEASEAMKQGGAMFAKGGYLAAADSKKRMGRKSAAQNVLGQNFALTRNAIVNAERNKASLHLLKMAELNPDEKFWTIDKKYDRQKNVEGETETDYKKSYEENVAAIYENGKKRYVKFHTAQGIRIADAIKGLTDEKAHVALKGMGKFNRFIGAMVTSYNPQFVLTNFARDYVHAGAIGYAKYGGKAAARIMKDTPLALASLLADDAGAKTEWGKWRQKCFEAGGRISFTGDLSWRDSMKQLENKIKDLDMGKANPKKIAHATLEVIETVNASVENAVRIACFRALVENGMPEAKAALAAKDLTVNFNRKGQQKWINSVWLFSNASIQGVENVASLFADKDPAVRKRAYAMAAAVASAGMAASIAGYALAGKGGNGRSEYENIPDYIKEMNIVLPAGDGKFIKFPLAHELNVIYNFGRMLGDAMRGKGFSPMDFAAGMTNNLLDAMNVFGSDIQADDLAGTLIRNATPAMGKPLLDIYTNRDFAGRQIQPENSKYGKLQKPDSRLYFGGVNPLFRELAIGLNDITGGSDYKSGAIDISPEKMEHIFNGYLGGLAKVIQQGTGIARTKMKGEDVEIRQIPFASRFYGSLNPAQDKQNMKQISIEANNIYAEFSDLKHSDPQAAKKFLEENYGEIQFSKAAAKFQSRLNEMGGRISKAEKAGKEVEELKKRRKSVSDQISSAEVKAWDKIRKAQTRAEMNAALEELGLEAGRIFGGK